MVCVPAWNRSLPEWNRSLKAVLRSHDLREHGFRRFLYRHGSDESVVSLSGGLEVMATSRSVNGVGTKGGAVKETPAGWYAPKLLLTRRLSISGYGLAPYCRVIKPVRSLLQLLKLFLLACVHTRGSDFLRADLLPLPNQTPSLVL